MFYLIEVKANASRCNSYASAAELLNQINGNEMFKHNSQTLEQVLRELKKSALDVFWFDEANAVAWSYLNLNRSHETYRVAAERTLDEIALNNPPANY